MNINEVHWNFSDNGTKELGCQGKILNIPSVIDFSYVTKSHETSEFRCVTSPETLVTKGRPKHWG